MNRKIINLINRLIIRVMLYYDLIKMNFIYSFMYSFVKKYMCTDISLNSKNYKKICKIIIISIKN